MRNPRCFIKKDGKAEIIDFQVERIPDPIITIGENEVKSIVQSSLEKNKVLLIKSANKNESFFGQYSIQYFKAYLNGETFIMNDNQISNELEQAIRKSQKGDKLILSSLKAFNKRAGTYFNLNSDLVFTIN